MKKNIFTLTLILSVIASGFSKTTPENPVNNKQKESISFTENKGQVYDQNYKARPDVLYGTMTGNMAVHIKQTGVSYQLYRVDSYKEESPSPALPNTSTTLSTGRERARTVIDQQTIYRIDLNWLNCNTNITKTEDKTLEGYNNYYLESCPDGALNVKSYKGVTLHNLYKGINLHYYEKNNKLKHDYIVAAHADYKQIQVKVEGAEVEINKDGSLILTTPLGKVQEGAPVVFQNGKRLKAKWLITNDVLSFDIENYNSNYELIIDPITRIFGTYYGDAGIDQGYSCTTDLNGNVFEVGLSTLPSGTVLATSGAHQTSVTGTGCAFLVKFNSNGFRQWGTYYGGTQGNEGRSCCTDGTGNVYICGNTSSSNGISTSGSHQFTYGSGSDGYLVKFNSSGVRLWGTYYGGSGNEYLYSCAIDGSANVYVAGETTTNTNTVIATSGSHQSSYGGGNSDAFLAKFNSSGVRQWGTYYGGSTGSDVASGCAVDQNGEVYLTGSTSSTVGTIMATNGSHQSIYGGGQADGFLAKFNGSGIRQWATYYGGNGLDQSGTCVTDPIGNVYLAGSTYTSTSASTIIATVSGFQLTYSGGFTDAFMVKFNTNGIRQWGSYYGGTGTDFISSSSTDALGNIYFAGSSNSSSSTVIATLNGHQPTFGGGAMDGFLVKFDAGGARQSATYYGGSGDDYGNGCSVDLAGSVYLAGETTSTSNIATTAGHQNTSGGFDDAFLVKFDACDLAPTTPSVITGSTSFCAGSTATYNTTQTFGASSYTWLLPSGWSGSSNSTSISATPGSSGIFTLTSSNACGVSPQQTLNVIVNALPTLNISSSNTLVCVGESALLTASGAVNYTFNPGGASGSITISPVVNTTYSLIGVDTNGCKNTAVITQSVSGCTDLALLDKAPEAKLHLFPNPTKGLITLELQSANEVIIINTLGQIVYSTKLRSGTQQIYLEDLARGIYFLKSEHSPEYIKFIKED